MFRKFTSNLHLYEYVKSKCLPNYPGRALLISPTNLFPFMRCASFCTYNAASTAPGQTTVPPEDFSLKPKLYFKQYMLNSPEYRSLVLDPNNLNLETEGRPESVKLLLDLINNPADEKLEKLILALKEERGMLDFEEICKFLFLTFNISRTNETLTEEIANMLTEELQSRTLSVPEILKALFALRETWGRRKFFWFEKKMRYKMFKKFNKLSQEQSMVFLYCLRKANEEEVKDEKFPVRQFVTETVHSLNGSELGFVLRFLFENKLTVFYELKSALLKRTADILSIHTTEDNKGFKFENEILLKNLCKFLQDQIRKGDTNDLLHFQERLIPYLSKLDRETVFRIVTVGNNVGCLNLRLWESVTKMVKENFNDYSLFCIERLVSAMAECNIQDEELLKLAIDRFERDCTSDLSDASRKPLIFFLSHLIHFGIYPKKLIDVVCAEGFIKYYRKAFHVLSKYWEIMCSLEIDQPEFTCTVFNEKQKARLSKSWLHSFHSSSTTWRFHDTITKMYDILREFYGGDDKVFRDKWHQTHGEGLFMRFDKDLKPQPIPDGFKSCDSSFRRPLNDDHIWVYVLLVPKDKFLFEGTPKACIRTQLRHLKALGYEPLMVSTGEIYENVFNGKEKEFLLDKMNNHLNEISQRNSHS